MSNLTEAINNPLLDPEERLAALRDYAVRAAGKPEGNGGKPVPAAVRACCIHRYNTVSLIPKSLAIWAIGFSCFLAGATASALNSFGYTRRSLSFFPVFFSFSVVFFAYLCVYQMG
jgi:hypothetical protein